MNFPTIALLTDFGDRDGFVGVLKSVLYSRLTQAVSVFDLCHHIEPQNIRHGAWVLQSALPYLPNQTVLVGVVDPAVGSEDQSSLVVYHPKKAQIFIAPDNGLLSPVFESETGLQVFHIQNTSFYKETTKQRSRTFHGRDVYAPIAAMAANALSDDCVDAFLDDFGRPIQAVCRLETRKPEQVSRNGQSILTGSIVHIDVFGNVITNIPNHWVSEGSTASIKIGEQIFQPIQMASTYQNATLKEVILVPSSGGTLEFAVNQGNAALVLQASIGQELTLTLRN
jgi:S-adenosylmethionine hydrolase